MLKSAIYLAEAGFSVIWLKYRQKMPVEPKWSTQPVMTPEDLEESYEKGRNIGVRLGKWSRVQGFYLHVLDLDIRDADYADDTWAQMGEIADAWGLKVSDFVRVISGSGGESRHLYFLTDKPFSSKKLWHTKESFVDEKGTKHWCAEIELFGTGKQVALPPSIHPDTLKEYRWEHGDFDPADLVDADSAKIEDMIGAEREQRYSEDIEPLGVSYKEAEDYIANLDLDGYCEDRAGWVRLGMALHHEFDGSPEALDVWRQFSKRSRKFNERVLREQWKSFKLDRSGDEIVTFASIVHASNENRWVIEQENVAAEFDEEDDDIEIDMPKPRKKRQREQPEPEDDDPAPEPEDDNSLSISDIPKHLLTVPGILGDAVKHYNEVSTTTQRQFAVQGALSLGSVVCGRYWTSEYDNYTSLYLVNLGVTGSGKEFGRTFLSRCLAESGLDELVGPGGYASAAGMMGAMIMKPRHVTTFDEFGKLLASTSGASNTNLKDAQTLLISIFGTLSTEVRPQAYSLNGKTKEQVDMMRKTVVRRPAVTVLGLSTPETFFDAVSQDDVANGFLNRLLVVNTREEPRVEDPRRWKRIPDRLKEWLIEYGQAPDADIEGLEDPVEVSEPEVVKFSADAKARLREIAQFVIDRQKDLRPMRLDGMWSRSKELTQRISLIVALSQEHQKISLSDVDWAWDYVRFYTEEMIGNTRRYMGASPVIRVSEHLADLIIEAGAKGMSMREMGRKATVFHMMNERDRKDVLARLESIFNIQAAKIKHKGAGRPTTVYVDARYIKERGRD